jgi:hypothetical protein
MLQTPAGAGMPDTQPAGEIADLACAASASAMSCHVRRLLWQVTPRQQSAAFCDIGSRNAVPMKWLIDRLRLQPL